MSNFENFKIGHRTTGRPFTHKRSEDITVTTSAQDLGPFIIEELQELQFYFVNKGLNTVSYKVYGSPSGLKSGDRDSEGVVIPQAEIDLEWKELTTGSITANNRAVIDLSSYKSYNYIKFEVNTSSGTSIINFYAMHKGTN